MNKAQIKEFIDLTVKGQDAATSLEGSRAAQEHIAALPDRQERDELIKYLAEVLADNFLARTKGGLYL